MTCQIVSLNVIGIMSVKMILIAIWMQQTVVKWNGLFYFTTGICVLVIKYFRLLTIFVLNV